MIIPVQSKKIKLTQRQHTLVDEADYEHLNQFKWHYTADGYAARRDKAQNWKYVYMHRVITNPIEKLEVDHINGDKLDNRRSNLRTCSKSQNGANKTKQSNNTSGYKGVTWNRRDKLWLARININRKSFHLGVYIDKNDAARAYNRAAVEYHGKFAKLNNVGAKS